MDRIEIIYQVIKSMGLVLVGVFVFAFVRRHLNLEKENLELKIKIKEKEIEAEINDISLDVLVQRNNKELKFPRRSDS